MNKNHFTLMNEWRSRVKGVPRSLTITTRLLRFVMLLCIGLYGQEMNAQDNNICSPTPPAFLPDVTAADNSATICGTGTAELSVAVTGGLPSVGTASGFNFQNGSQNELRVFNLNNDLNVATNDPFNTGSSAGNVSNTAVVSTDFVGSTQYALDAANNQLHTVVGGTLSAAFVTATPVTGEDWKGIAFDESSGTTYAVSAGGANSTIYILDVTTGTATPIGATGIADLNWLAIDANGNAYSTSTSTDALYAVNLNTATTTLVGATGVDLVFSQDADFDPETGLLYTMAYTLSGGTYQSEFALVDLSTGAYSVLFAGPSGGVNATPHFVGFALVNNTPFPYTYAWSTGETTQTITVSTPGIYTVTVSDFCGNSDVATVSVDQEALNTSMACNANINTNLDENGQAIITPATVLEGENGCLDGYTVNVANTGSNIADCSLTGPFSVEVFDENGASVCWNDGWIVEDKSEPIIQCGDFELSCTASRDPNSIVGPVSGTKTFAGAATAIADNDPAGTEIVIAVPNGCTLPVTDLNVLLAVDHANISDLTATLTSPSGTSVVLFARPGQPGPGCPNTIFDVVFDDEAVAANFETSCGVPALNAPNNFQALQSLTVFEGEDPSGNWTLTVFDSAAGSTGSVTAASIVIEATFGNGGVTATDNCGVVSLTSNDANNIGCTVDGFGFITRTWTATDAAGNSATCSQTITLTRPSLDDIVCPANRTGDDAVSCSSNFPIDINGHPSPTLPLGTGEPTFDGNPIDGVCNFSFAMVDSLPYTDDVFPGSCPGSITYKRTWMILDNCTDTMRICEQVIHVIDTTGPTITCPANTTVNAHANCVANFIVPTPAITDVCSPAGINYNVTSSAGTVVSFGIAGFIVNGLPIEGSPHIITYTAFDGCNNSSTCSFEVTVEDHQAPVLPCQTNTTVGLSNDGSEVHWNTFLNLSNVTDNCGVAEIVVRRMDMPQCAGNDSSPFAETVPFFCCDIDNQVTVEVRATDISGNVNTCMIFATVMDNVAPIFSPCPSATAVVDCDDLAALDTYEDITADADGIPDVPAPGPLTYIIELDDSANLDTVFFGYYNNNIWDNCDTEVFISTTGSVNECGNSVDANGNLAPLQRRYVAVDQSGNVSAPCIQAITITNPDAFNPATDITDRPDDFVNPGALCGTSIFPDSLPVGFQRPVISSTSGCDNTAVGYTDTNPLYPVNGSESFCYKILRTWYVFDWCGMNNDTFTQVIMVVDPGPVFDACPGPISVPSGNNLVINVSATNLCSNPSTAASITYEVDLNNDGTVDSTGITGNIDEVTGGVAYPEGTHRITFTAEGCTTNSTCEVVVTVTPMAPPSAISSVSGSISNESNSMVENVTVSPASGTDVAMTNANGVFNLNLATSENYTVTPEKDDDYLNGVSTYDIVLMSKHILETQLLDSPYKMIAGDINKSGGITTIDMVELRKVILFIDDEFTNNKSWRFVDAEYVFPNAANPFEEVFPETYAINDLTGDMADLDFVAVKIGDVNGSATTNGFSNDAEGRDFNGTLELEMNEAQLKAGQTHTIEVTAKDFDQLLGYQFTMAFDGLEVTEVLPGELAALTTANFGLQNLQEGILMSSWNHNDAQSLADGSVLFSVTVKATSDVKLSEALRVSSQYTTAEAYTEKAGTVELLDLELNFRDNNGATVLNTFELYQNRPNPFKNETVIGFDLPKEGAATLSVYDLSGRLLTKVTGSYGKGYHEVSINRSDLPSTGVLYYELATEGNTAIRKMTIIE